MAESSLRAARPEHKGGLSNALFVVAAAERLPPELAGIAAEVTIAFPWGSLLRGTLALDDAAQAAIGIAGLVAPGGRVRALVSIDPRDRLDLPAPADTPASELAARWCGYGLRLRDWRPATEPEIAAAGSTWARRLRAGRDRSVWRLELHRPARPQPPVPAPPLLPPPGDVPPDGYNPPTMPRRRDRLRTLLLAVLAGAILALELAPAVAATPRRPVTRPTPAAVVTQPTPAAIAAQPFRLDLAHRNDFVAQSTFVQCVGASMQMMLNIMGGSDRTAKTQRRLQSLARSLSGPTRDGFERKGASVRGWTDGLNALGAGPYRLVGAATIEEAMRVAAGSIRETGRPVGLLVWAGRHAWVMSGFQATADPAGGGAFRVTEAIVLDPLYPYGSSQWGRSPRPREAISIASLGRQFVPRRRGTWAGAPTGAAGATMRALAGKYVIVMPFMPVWLARTAHVAA
jgi:hypothetical protein